MENSLIGIFKLCKATLIDEIIDILFGGTSDKLKLLVNKMENEGRISDLIVLNNFGLFLMEGNFNYDQLRKLSAKLDEYGNRKMCAIAIIKAVEDIESEEKARCIANLTQSVINSQIDTRKYLKLIRLARQLIGDDFNFLSSNISKEKFLQHDYLDDYLINGLIKQVDAGYVYTDNAWDLVEYGILRGHDVNRPDKIEDRPITSIELDHDFGYMDEELEEKN